MSVNFPEIPRRERRRPVDLVLAASALALMLAGPLWFVLGPGGRDGGAWEPAPRPTTRALLDGSWRREFEGWLGRNAAPALFLGANTRAVEALFEDPTAPQLVEGRRGWLFLRGRTGDLDPDEHAESRRAFLNAVGERARRAGVRVVFVICPNKASVLTRRADSGDDLPPGRRRWRAAFGADCEAAGVELFDPTDALRALARDMPAEPLYMWGDSHWNLEASATAAILLAQRFDLGGVDASPRPDQPLIWRHDVPTDGEFTGRVLGFHGRSFLDEWLLDRRSSAVTVRRTRVGSLRDTKPMPGASVALAGDSFAPPLALMLHELLGAELDSHGVDAGSLPTDRVEAMFDELGRGGFAPRTLVFAHVEENLARRLELPRSWGRESDR